jgi:hypothetical protein
MLIMHSRVQKSKSEQKNSGTCVPTIVIKLEGKHNDSILTVLATEWAEC